MQKTERVETTKHIRFSIPRSVQCHKSLMPNGKWSYVFRHKKLGEIGRVFFLPRHDGRNQLCCEVSGEPDDPMTKKRLKIFEPINRDVVDQVSLICEETEDVPYDSPKETYTIPARSYSCAICEVLVAMLIFAFEGDTNADLEDYARMMYKKVRESNVPTWVVGRETANIVNGKDLRKSLVLKIHPEREAAIIMTPDELKDKIYKLMTQHCRK